MGTLYSREIHLTNHSALPALIAIRYSSKVLRLFPVNEDLSLSCDTEQGMSQEKEVESESLTGSDGQRVLGLPGASIGTSSCRSRPFKCKNSAWRLDPVESIPTIKSKLYLPI